MVSRYRGIKISDSGVFDFWASAEMKSCLIVMRYQLSADMSCNMLVNKWNLRVILIFALILRSEHKMFKFNYDI